MIRYLGEYTVELLLYTVAHNEGAIFQFDLQIFSPFTVFQMIFRTRVLRPIRGSDKKISLKTFLTEIVFDI